MNAAAPRSLSWSAAAALAIPLLAVALCSARVVVGWMAGANPFWDGRPLTVSEAAMVRDHAEVVRLIHGGADPNRSWLVASDFSDSHRPETITPLEAAVQIRRLELVELLVREGATVDEPVRARLVARARDLHADDIVAYLNRRGEGPR